MLRRIVHWTVAHPAVYDCVQLLAGQKESTRRPARHLTQAAGLAVLDVSAGTGNMASASPETADYIWLDNDLDKLRGFSSKRIRGKTILCDATKIPLPDKSVDYATCVAVAHHLSDDEFAAVLKELARVVRTRLVLLDAVMSPASWVSRFLWNLDRGAYPRTTNALFVAVGRCFEASAVEQFAVFHRYLLLAAQPR